MQVRRERNEQDQDVGTVLGGSNNHEKRRSCERLYLSIVCVLRAESPVYRPLGVLNHIVFHRSRERGRNVSQERNEGFRGLRCNGCHES